MGRLFGTCQQAARGVQDRAISVDWSGAEGLVPLATPHHGEERRAEHEAQAPAVCVLWRRKTHLHHPLDHAHIPAQGGGRMRPPTRTPHRGVMGIIFCEPLAPFLHPGLLSVLSCGLTPGGRPEGVVAASRGERHGLASILRANEFSSSRKANTLLFCSIVPQALAPLDPLLRHEPPFHKLSRFDELTPAGVSMTESHTQRADGKLLA
jgi:hypothetical protein